MYDSSSIARCAAVWAPSTRARARWPMLSRSRSLMWCRYERVSSALPDRRISDPGSKKRSSPGQVSLTIGVPHAAASNSRTLGEYPACTMSLRVTFNV